MINSIPKQIMRHHAKVGGGRMAKDFGPDSFNYKNLEYFLVTGENLECTNDNPRGRFELTDKFVREIQALGTTDEVTRSTYVRVGSEYGVSFNVPQSYHKAYQVMIGNLIQCRAPDKKKVKIEEEEYRDLLRDREELIELRKRVASYEKETYRLRDKNLELNKMYDEYDVKIRKAIKEIGRKRWHEL